MSSLVGQKKLVDNQRYHRVRKSEVSVLPWEIAVRSVSWEMNRYEQCMKCPP